MALRSRLRRRGKTPPVKWQQRVVVILRHEGENVLRMDIPLVLEEDDDGIYPTIQFHHRHLREFKVDEVEASPRHRGFDA